MTFFFFIFYITFCIRTSCFSGWVQQLTELLSNANISSTCQIPESNLSFCEILKLLSGGIELISAYTEVQRFSRLNNVSCYSVFFFFQNSLHVLNIFFFDNLFAEWVRLWRKLFRKKPLSEVGDYPPPVLIPGWPEIEVGSKDTTHTD